MIKKHSFEFDSSVGNIKINIPSKYLNRLIYFSSGTILALVNHAKNHGFKDKKDKYKGGTFDSHSNLPFCYDVEIDKYTTWNEGRSYHTGLFSCANFLYDLVEDVVNNGNIEVLGDILNDKKIGLNGKVEKYGIEIITDALDAMDLYERIAIEKMGKIDKNVVPSGYNKYNDALLNMAGINKV